MTNANLPENGVTILDDIPVNINVSTVLESFKSAGSKQRAGALLGELIELVMPVVRPKVVYRVATVTAADGRRLVVDGVEFTHHVPALSFRQGERVFPYVATCGLEVEAIRFPNNVMKDYFLNLLKNVILMRSAVGYFQEYLKRTYHLEEVSRIGPGEAMGSTSQQRKLFSLLGDVESSVGVKLSAHNMMVPEKSASGIYFETAVSIESCQLCPNDCKSRRAAYEPGLFQTFRKKE